MLSKSISVLLAVFAFVGFVVPTAAAQDLTVDDNTLPQEIVDRTLQEIEGAQTRVEHAINTIVDLDLHERMPEQPHQHQQSFQDCSVLITVKEDLRLLLVRMVLTI